MPRLVVVVGAQCGSEGKGAVAGHVATELRDPICVRVGGSNAGHTVVDRYGRRWALRHVPVGLVTNERATGHIASGSELDADVLIQEVSTLERAGFLIRGRLTVSPQVTLVMDNHKRVETEGLDHGMGGLTKTIGSTGKGVGAARADRAMRRAPTLGNHTILPGIATRDLPARPVQDVLVEGTQGYWLGLHAGYYPYCTSADCRVIDTLAQAGLSPWGFDLESILVARVYPIRVAGNSGPLPYETSWEALGLPQEHTTVTKKVRRVGEWDPVWVAGAIRGNGGPHPSITLAITMVDQMFPAVADSTELTQEAITWLQTASDALRTPINLVGTGPSTYFHPPV